MKLFKLYSYKLTNSIYVAVDQEAMALMQRGNIRTCSSCLLSEYISHPGYVSVNTCVDNAQMHKMSLVGDLHSVNSVII